VASFFVSRIDALVDPMLEAVFQATQRQWNAAVEPNDEFLDTTGRVMEQLSEHQCEGWLEGYLLTGRHGLFNCYEASIHIVDSMFNQHAKWLKVAAGLPWRPKIASLNYLLSSHVWRQDLDDDAFDALFTRDRPVIFAYHAYPWLIHRLTYRRANHENIHVRGYKEEGKITTPFDMTVLNDMDRYHLVMDTIDRLPGTGDKGLQVKRMLQGKLVEHRAYIEDFGEDMPEIKNWVWTAD